ncbi:hypothetical protein CP533_2519 [Ophiocordyceps camponoti-saundersi (nom. inval.)]|nr:hypothetical protein CP533_2519 [Ophiocordyceps camponoti-saundersi (nom. inval.)]
MEQNLNEILKSHVTSTQDTTNKLLGASFILLSTNEKDTPKTATLYKGSAGRIGFDLSSPAFSVDSFTWLASLTNMLLTHTLGTTYVPMTPDLIKWSQKQGRPILTTDWSIEGLSVPLAFAPGDGWIYGTSLDWAGLLIERVTGMSLGAYMESNIFRPLGMNDTGFWPDKLPQTASRTVAWCHRKPSSDLEPMERLTPVEHEFESGGAGLYGTADDYARFLRGLLDGKLVGDDGLSLVFSPQLNDSQKKALNDMIYRPGFHRAAAPEFPLGIEIDHSIGGVINLQDVPGKRRKGSLMWSGMCNSHWWIDRETGIAAVLIVNVLDSGDAVVVQLYDELERAVYAGRK